MIDGYTLVASKALAIDSNGAVFDGAGAGLFTLQHTPGDPLTPLAPVAPEKLELGGFVRALEVTDEHVYAAAWRRGLVAIRRSDTSIVNTGVLAGTEGARSLAVLDADASACPSKRIVIVGTDDPLDTTSGVPGTAGGRLVIVEHDLASDTLAVRAAFDVGATVQCVAASLAIAPPPSGTNDASFTVLLGADCARIGASRASLQRRDFSYHCANGALVITEDARTPWPAATSAPECIVRDVVIDETRARAYAAAYFHGVFAFDVANGTLTADASPGWPLVERDGQGVPRASHANTLALDPAPESAPNAGARLCVGWGKEFAGEWQFFGDSSRPECASAPGANGQLPVDGVFVYRLDVNDDPVLVGADPVAELELTPSPLPLYGVEDVRCVRYGGADYHLAIAGDTSGLALVRVTPGSGGSTAVVEASWDERDPARLALKAHDDAVVLSTPNGDFLHVATEVGVAAFDLATALRDARTSNPTFGSIPAPFSELVGAVTLGVFPPPNARLVGATQRGVPGQPGGVQVYDLATPDRPLALGAELQKDGRGFALAAVLGAWNGATKPTDADRRRWVFTTQSDGTDVTKSYTVKLFDLGTQNAPNDPDCAPPCTPAALVATWQDAPAADALEGIAVREVNGGRELAVYVPFGVNGDAPRSLASARAGVVVLRVTLDGAGVPHFTKVQKLVSFSDVDPTFKAGRATLDAASERLFVAWGTGGLAAYDTSSPYQLTPLAKRDLSQEIGAYGTRLSPTHVVLGAKDCDREFVYVAFLDDGVGVLDADLTGAIGFVPVAGQAISLTLDPRDPARRTVFVSEGRAGVEKLVIDPCE
ncbi:MAG: hypothetical protein L6Q99_03060 [Planctomycetes bacterium]|nr:hypothetical protein [Planctomycetota bacterium]